MTDGLVRPPRLARALASRLAPAELHEPVLGDLDEQFAADVAGYGTRRAARRYWRQVLALACHWPLRRRVRQETRPFQEPAMSALMQDLRYVARHLLRHPSYLLVGVLSLSLAIAANGVVFGLVNGVVLNPFNYPENDKLVSIGAAFPAQGQDLGFIERHSPAEVDEFAAIPALTRLGAFDLGNRVLSRGEVSERLFTALILRDPIPAMGVPMTLGRGFTAEELAPGGPGVVIVSHRLWLRMLGGDPDIIGTTVRVNTDSAQVVGVLGAGVPLLGTDLWIPWGGDPAQMPRDNRPFSVLARLAPGAAIADVDAALGTISARARIALVNEYPEYADWRLSAATWSAAVTGAVFPAGMLLLAAGVVVLLVACVNLASLLLARLAIRQRELAVRRALGAADWRIARMLVLESLLVAGLAVVAGILLARAALAAVPAMLPARVAGFGFMFQLDATVVVYCALSGAAASLLTVLPSAWQGRRAVAPSLASAGRGTAGPARARGRRALIVAEVALAVMLLISAGLFLQSYTRIADVDPGFNAAGLLTMRLTIDSRKYPGEQASDFFAGLVDQLARTPGVRGAAAVNQLPTVAGFDTTFTIEGQPLTEGTQPNAFLTIGSPHLFDVLDTPLRSGRKLTDQDRAGSQPVALVNEAFARRYLNGEPTGRLRIGQDTLVDIVGVVADVRNQSLMAPARPEIFATMQQAGRGNNQYFLLLRTSGAPMAFLPAARKTLAALDAAAPFYLEQTMEEVIATEILPQRLAMVTVGVFAAGALIVAGLGVYGLIAHWVVSRRREIGIRLALGGSSLQVMTLVVGQAARLIVAGALLGTAGGVAGGYAAASLLFDTAPADPVTLAAVLLLLAVVGLLAALLPARRAMAVDPVEVLRAE